MLPVLAPRDRAALALSVGSRMLAVHRKPLLAARQARLVWRAHSRTGEAQAFAGYGNYGGDWGLGLLGALPGSEWDWGREAGDPTFNGVVSIGVNWVKRQLPEPDVCVKRQSAAGAEEIIPDHPLPRFLAEPNPYHDGDEVLAALAQSYLVAGQAYARLVLDNLGRLKELWFVPHWEIAPRWANGAQAWPEQSAAYLADYIYRPAGSGREILLRPEEVLHLRFDLNPYNSGRTATQPLFALLRSIVSDNEAETYIVALLKNMGIPGHYVGPGSDDPQAFIEKTQREELEQLWVTKFGGDNRGKPLVASHKLDIKQLGLGPEQLRLEKIRQIPTYRILAALGLHPSLVGLDLGTGTGAFDTGGQTDAVRRQGFEDCIAPMLARFALGFQRRLLPFLGEPGTETVSFDYSRVRCLQPDMDALFKRYDSAWKSGWVKRSEARSAVGLPVTPEDEVYFTPPAAGAGVEPDEDEEEPPPRRPPPRRQEEEDDD